MEKNLYYSIEPPPEKWVHLTEAQYTVNKLVILLLGLVTGLTFGAIITLLLV